MEALLAAVLITAVLAGGASAGVVGPAVAVLLLLAVQAGVVRRRLGRRSDRVLAGEQLPRSRGHLAYVALEVAKAVLLVVLGVALLSV